MKRLFTNVKKGRLEGGGGRAREGPVGAIERAKMFLKK
jgi:hypothetical protein